MGDDRNGSKDTSNRRLLMPSDLWATWQVCHLKRRHPSMPESFWNNARRNWLLHQKLQMLDTLAHDFNIDPNSRDGYALLALRLAEKHEPGFQDEAYEKSVRRRGRPVRKVIDYAQLLFDVDNEFDRSKLKSNRKACKALAGRGRWKGFSATALEKAVSRARADLCDLDTSHPVVSFLIEQAEAADRTVAERALAIERAAAAEKTFEEELAKAPCDRKRALLLS